MFGKELLVRLGLDGSGYNLGLKRVESMTARWGRSLRNNIMGYVGAAFSVNMISRGIRDLLEFGGTVDDLAKRTGLSTDEVQAFNYVLAQNGVEINELGMAFDFLNDKMQEAFTNSTSDAAKAFRALGIDLSKFKTSDVGKVFQEIARAVQSMGANSESVAAVRDLLGRSGAKMIPGMRQGLADVVEEVRKLGGIIEKELIEKIDRAGDEWTKMSLKFQAATASPLTSIYSMLGNALDHQMAVWKFLGKIPSNVKKMGARNIFDAIMTSAVETRQEIENANLGPDYFPPLPRRPKRLPEPTKSEITTRKLIDTVMGGLSKQGIFLRGLPAGEQNIPRLQLQELKKIEKNTKDKGDTIIVPS